MRIFHFVSVLWILRYNDAYLFIYLFLYLFKIINEPIESRLESGKEDRILKFRSEFPLKIEMKMVSFAEGWSWA